MKTYVFLNVKGGVGKTTSATTIAHILASEYSKKVLLIDLDPQGNCSSLFSTKKVDYVQALKKVLENGDLSLLKEYPCSVSDVLVNSDTDINNVIYRTKYDKLDIIPSFIDLSDVETKLKEDYKSPQQFRLKRHLDKVSNNYDYCIIDCSPAVNLVNINGLVCANYVFTPLKCDLWGFAGYYIAQSLVEVVKDYNSSLTDIRCFLTQYDARTNIAQTTRETMKAALGNHFIDIQIRKCIKAEEITYVKKALTDYADKTTVSEDYKKLTEFIVNHY